jgi:acetyl-CoA carboxylase biotin carboxylase subunit
MFRKVLIANRGEIACRIARACRALGAIPVFVYSEADSAAPYIRIALASMQSGARGRDAVAGGEAICIGPAAAADSYLNEGAVLRAAAEMECQALHPGYGFLSENARFAQRCEDAGIAFVGPRPRHIRLMGDKAIARRTMEQAGLPVMPGSSGELASLEEALAAAENVGYPVLLKASAGGGGKGMRLVENAASMREQFDAARAEAERAFGNSGLYMEHFFDGARHIEFQVLADGYGKVIHLGERECSIQRNRQKLIEEAPAFGFDDVKRAKFGGMLCEVLRKVGYLNAGTVEFLQDRSGKLYFMEMNTRIQVEHPVTEMVTGVDLVQWQLRIAAGERLSLNQDDIMWRGAAIECRLNAEDPAAAFRPSPGIVKQFEIGLNAGHSGGDSALRVESFIEPGSAIPSYYDSMVAKVIAWGKDRDGARRTLLDALKQSRIEGIATTKTLHESILAHPAFAKGNYSCQFLSQYPELLNGTHQS